MGLDGDDLVITSASDAQDGSIDQGIIIEDYNLGGDNIIEIIELVEGYYYL